MQAQNNPNTSIQDVLFNFSPWINNKNPSYPLNRYILRRNIAGFAFSEKISKADASSISQKLSKILYELYPNGQYFKSNEVKDKSTHLLFEHLFIPNREKLHPEGGIFIDIENNFIAIFHLEDHLTVFFHDTELQGEKILLQISALDEKIQEHIPLAYSDKFGFITASTANLGTGLAKEAILHAPAINILHKEIEENDKVFIHGLHAEKNALHNLVIAANKYCLGISEKNIISNVDEVAKNIYSEEIASKKQLQTSPPKDFLNTLSKNFGLVSFCKSLEFHEALNIASSIDLAISLDLLQSPNKTFFFDLFFSLRRAHLEAFFSKDNIPIEEKRALLFKEKIKDLKFCL